MLAGPSCRCLWHDDRVRLIGAIALAIIATIAGLFGIMLLGLSGLTLAGPGLMVIEYSDADDFERSAGIVMGFVALATWLLLIVTAVIVGLTGPRPGRAWRVAVWISAGLSTALVLTCLAIVLSTVPRSLV
jgi:hypothetical protein